MEKTKTSVPYKVLSAADIFGSNGVNIRVNKANQSKLTFHKHDFFEFVYVEKGFIVHNHNGRTHILTAGDVLCIIPGQIHSYTMAYEATIFNILFSKEELGSFLNEVSSIGVLKDIFSYCTDILPTVKLNIHQRHELDTLMTEMQDEQAVGLSGWKSMMRVYIVKFLIFFARAYAMAENEKAINTADGSVYYGYILKTLKFIEENFKEDITSAEIAANVGISSDYITKQFKKELEITPLEYLRKYRIAKAIELIKTTDMSISDISVACGFNDLSLFSRVFKQTFGLTPRDFKKEIQN